MLPDAIKNPLIYLNFSIYCYSVGKAEQAKIYLKNFMEISQQTDVNRDVSQKMYIN